MMDVKVYMWNVIRDIVELNSPDIVEANYYPEARFAVLRLNGNNVTPDDVINKISTDRKFDNVDFLPLYEWNEDNEMYNEFLLLVFRDI